MKFAILVELVYGTSKPREILKKNGTKRTLVLRIIKEQIQEYLRRKYYAEM